MTLRYKDASLPCAERAADLLGRMTLEEKIAQMHALWLLLAEDGQHKPRLDDFANPDGGDALQRQLAHGLGQISRPLGSHQVDARRGVRALNALQKHLCEHTRLGIPVMSHEECLVGLMAHGATLFPSALAYGATWNPALVEQVATAIGREARSIGCHQGLAPVLDVSRDVRWGRTEETFGEDPYLVGVMATHYVRGLQGPRRDLLATLKHYVGHSASEGARNHAPVNLGWRELNDTFMLPFEMAVRLANAGSVMPAYHDIDHAPCHASHYLLTEVLREQWGFDGLVVADYAGIALLYQHHGVARDAAEAAAQAFNAGLDIELPGSDCAAQLRLAMERGAISMEKVDEIVGRILLEKFRLGLFEHPYVDEEAIALATPATVALAREVARESVVVLKNDGVLPIATASALRIAMIGPTADDPLALLGGYSFPVHLILNKANTGAEGVVTPLQACRAVFGDSRVHYAKGCDIIAERVYGSPVFPGDVNEAVSLDRASLVSQDTSAIAQAVACAQAADVAIVCVGDLAGLFQTGTIGEGSDTDSLALPGVQQQLLEAVVATGKPVVVVLHSGRPYHLGGLDEQLAAVVSCFASGQEGGPALLEVLTGAVPPSGRLTVSAPVSAGAVPYFYNHKYKSSGTPVALHFGSRYPFGHGLGYTRFEYSDLQIAADAVDSEDGQISLSFTLRNVGERAGVEVAQLYVRDVFASCVRPVKELKAFVRVSLEAGEGARVRMQVPCDMLNFTSMSGKRVVEPGDFELYVGASSADIRLRGKVAVLGRERVLGRDWCMESQSTWEILR